MDLSVQQVTELLCLSRLHSNESAENLTKAWIAQAGDQLDRAEVFLRWLADQRHITEYQAQLIGRGYADGHYIKSYQILERIGRGKMAGVYRARGKNGQDVAIKVLPPSRSKEPDLLARFQREAALALRLKHRNTVLAYETGEADGLHYLVMEHLEGETLEDVLARRGKLPVKEAVELMSGLLDGLQHIHEQGLVHRDLKPANIMIVPVRKNGEPDTTTNRIVKIVDIGLGRMAGGEASDGDSQLTASGAILGTPDYMAPEQARDAKSVDIRADIYSIGCIFYHVLTGQQPFPDSNLISQMVKHATDPIRPLAELGVVAPAGLEALIQRMMAKSPGDRFDTPADASLALLAVPIAQITSTDRTSAMPAQLSARLDWLELRDGLDSVPTAPSVADRGDGPRPISTTEVKIPAAIDRMAREAKSEKPRPFADSPIKPRPNPRRPATAEVPVPEKSPASHQVESRGLQLTRRDLLMMSLGAAGALVAVCTGLWISRQMRVEPTPLPDD